MEDHQKVFMTKDYLKFVSRFSTAVIRSEEDNRLILEDARYFRVGESGFLLMIDRGTAMVREVFSDNKEDVGVFLGYLAHLGYESAIMTAPGEKFPYAMVKTVHPGISLSDFQGGYTNLNFD